MNVRIRLGALSGLVAIGLACATLSGLTQGRLPALGVGLWIANLLGWCALILLLLLCLLPLRRRRLDMPPLITPSAHRLAGYLTLTFVIAHAVASLWLEPETWAYWLPTAPLYMLLAQVSAVVLVFMIALAVRARWHGAGPAFSRTHLLLSLLILALSLAHMAGSAAIAYSSWRLLPWALLGGAAALLPLRAPVRN